MNNDQPRGIAPPHFPALDGLRGVAILMVVLTHVGSGWTGAESIFRVTTSLPDTFAIPLWLWQMTDFGMCGVQLFFVVSAFTLTTKLASTNNDLARYALRRIMRVGPGYWLAGVAYTLVVGLAPRAWAPDGVSVHDVALAAVFGSAWQSGASLAVVPGGWSVSVEMAFYAALPLLLRVIDGKPRRALALLGLSLVVAEAWFLHLAQTGAWNFLAYCNPIEQAPVFLCGVTGALLVARGDVPAMPYAALGMFIVAIVFLPCWHSLVVPTHLQFALMISIATALYAVHPPLMLRSRIMMRIGQVSYSMYLLHFAVLYGSLTIAERLFPASDWVTMLVHYGITATASFFLACFTYALIEKPAIDWAARQRPYRWSSASASAKAPGVAGKA